METVQAGMATDLACSVILGGDWKFLKEVVKGWWDTSMAKVEPRPGDPRRQDMATVAEEEPREKHDSGRQRPRRRTIHTGKGPIIWTQLGP